MSKSIGKVFGSGSTGKYGYEKNYINYLNNYDTQNYDNTLNNLTSEALRMSNNLSLLPDYQFSAQGDDEARKRMEEAMYQSYTDKLNPQFERQTENLETRLINKGLPVGSEAYQRAMNDLQDSQNEALSQAVYQSVASGQDAYSKSLQDNMYTAKFNNEARQSYIDQVLSMLADSVSGYQNQNAIYNANAGVQNRINQARASRWNTFRDVVGSASQGIASGLSGNYASILGSGQK